MGRTQLCVRLIPSIDIYAQQETVCIQTLSCILSEEQFFIRWTLNEYCLVTSTRRQSGDSALYPVVYDRAQMFVSPS